jgi:tRNA A-37 threonylcarbamoyl transferase component Bud32
LAEPTGRGYFVSYFGIVEFKARVQRLFGNLMTATIDQAAGRIALRNGWVTREVLHRAIQFKAQYSVKEPLIQILCDRGFLTHAQVQEVLQIQQNESRRPPRVIPKKSARDGSSRVPINKNPSDRVKHQSKGSERKRRIVETCSVDSSVIADDGTVDIVGRTIGGCQVSEKLGQQGAMGCLFLAQHQNLNRKVVVKVLPPENATKKKNLERFLREARAAAKLEHPNIVQVLNVDKSPEGLYYIVMQFVDGKNLEQLIKEKERFEWKDATRIISEAAAGLQLAHRNGIIHRDIKADNIMVTNNGVTKVADFGLAKDQNTAVNITRDNAFIGTLIYMAPEIGRIKDIDGRVDIYSLGITYYYMLTGKQPFRGFKPMELLSKRAHEKISPPENFVQGLPMDLRRLLGKMLIKDRDNRYSNMDELIDDLTALKAGVPISIKSQTFWAEEGLSQSIELEDGSAPPNKILIAIVIGLIIILALVVTIAIMMLP